MLCQISGEGLLFCSYPVIGGYDYYQLPWNGFEVVLIIRVYPLFFSAGTKKREGITFSFYIEKNLFRILFVLNQLVHPRKLPALAYLTGFGNRMNTLHYGCEWLCSDCFHRYHGVHLDTT